MTNRKISRRYIIMENGFAELSADEMTENDGGVFPVLFVIWGVEVTVGHALAAGAAIGL